MTTEPWITTPGVYHDIPAADYHADPVVGGSLSASDARLLLPPSCPARYRWRRDHPETPRAHYELGHAAHRLVLGAGPDIVEIDADNWRTKAAKAAADEARAAGATPLLTKDYATVLEMADALRRHRTATLLLSRGRPEVTLVWRRADVMLRARLDWLPDRPPERTVIVPDYKTCDSADPDTFQRRAYEWGYFVQAENYLDGLRALGWADPTFVIIAQEKTPPYVVTVFQPDIELGLRLARDDLDRAIEIYADCTAADQWPGYADDVVLLRLPPWRERTYAQEVYG